MIWGSFLLIGLALVLVNGFGEKPVETSSQVWITKGKSLSRPDWITKGYQELLKESPDDLHLHAQYISHLDDHNDSLNKAIASYFVMAQGRKKYRRALGNICSGLIYNKKRDYLRAKLCFNRVRMRGLPYLHAGIGDAEAALNRYDKAEAAYKTELELDSGKHVAAAFHGLARLYIRTQKKDSLWKLWENPEAKPYVPHNAIRAEAFRRGEFVDYGVIISQRLFDKFTWSGFLAALLVTAVWLAYLLQLHIFSAGSRRFIAFAFGLGMLMSVATYIMSDFQHFTLGLEPSGGWLASWLYHVCAIGLIEEFAKILPLLLIIQFRRSVREPYDLILYACTSALGFAFIENGLYYDGQHLHIIHARAMTAVVGHMFQASLIAYTLAWRHIRARRFHPWLVFAGGLILAGIWHGSANFFLHQGLRLPYLVQLTLGLYLWTLFINNTLNASPFFDNRLQLSPRRLMSFVMLGLTAILVFEYLLAAYHFGPDEANMQLKKAALSGSFLIVLLAFMLSRFRLKQGFWRRF
ncbi:MAG: PrsW family glutamic-type intramembrane protease [Bacteroidia bacterium]